MKEVTIKCNGFWLCHTQNKLLAHMNMIIKHAPIYNRHDIFKPGVWCDWFLEFFLPVMRVCVFVCPPLRLLITSGLIWYDMEPLWLVKQVLGIFLLFIW